jgi:CHAT domain-containing protein
LGNDAAAERDLAAALGELELQRERIDNPEERIAYFDRAREILDAMLLLQLEQLDRPEVAFEYSEQAKSRALLDWVAAHPFERSSPSRLQTSSGKADLTSLQSGLPEHTVVVEYSVLPRKLVIWIFRRDAFNMEIVTGPADLEVQVRRLSRALSLERKADVLKEASRVQAILIRPIEKYLEPDDRIVVVPDGVLHAVPFGLLYDARTRRYAVEDHIWSVAPSARLLIASLRRSEELSLRRSPRALVVVDPAFDQEVFPTLRRLGAAKSEANAAMFFTGSRVFSDQDATRGVFLQEAGDYEIVHFGGHSLVNSSFPLLSQMLFAPAADDPSRGILYSGDLLGLSFERTRLTVLASCSTAAGRISRTEGVQSLARPFLAAGVPSVIASLWDVDDAKTAELFSHFYRHLSASFDPAAALRQAQIESLRQGMEPWAWGAFELIGGSSPGR